MPEPKISNEDVRQYGAKLHDEMHGWNCNCAPSFRFKFEEYAERVLADLAAAGRLLPSGGEVKEQWGVRFTELLGHASPYVQPYSSEHNARQYAAADWRPHRTGELVNRRVTTWPDGTELTDPWSPVLSDNSSEEQA